ncbi:beta-defensin 110-like [Vulpes lagopus]|uniref:beta-defensin 110-like n=1 Tax=Vulpes lagopus TaxID=494514 RepID=UPI001BC8FC6D|nr:beta-defensin 110-like [Vulpes lagopus]
MLLAFQGAAKGPLLSKMIERYTCLESNITRSNFDPKYRFERCAKVKGICKTFCDDDEYDYGYCIKWRNQCCI